MFLGSSGRRTSKVKLLKGGFDAEKYLENGMVGESQVKQRESHEKV